MPYVRRNAGWFTTGLIIALLVSGMSWWCWDWLRNTQAGYESPSTTIRNLGLFLAAPIALLLAIWRARVADRQAKAAQTQVTTSQGSLLNERYQKGAEMLSSGALSARLGGIYALARLAREHPEEYHIQIIRLLCAFLRNPPPENDEAVDADENWRPPKLRPDIQEIMREIGGRADAQIDIEEQQEDYYGLDLHYAELPDANLVGANLADANLIGADLTGADLCDAVLISADLGSAALNGVNLTDADLTGVNLRDCKGLTQEQLDEAKASDDNPPNLRRTLDAETSEQLEWRGKPLNE